MRKLILVLFLLISFINFDDCYAFSRQYDYNYEVSYFDFDGINGEIRGWAILNAGVNDGSSGEHRSPSLRRAYESTDGYDYHLTFYGLNSSGGVVSSYTYYDRGGGVSLTKLMCYKSKGSCKMNRSPYYDDVEFHFRFSTNNLSNLSSISKYRFELKVTSDGGKSRSFGLAFLEDALTSRAKEYVGAGERLQEVIIVANDFHMRDYPGQTSTTGKKVDDAGDDEEILDTHKIDPITWYKVSMKGYTGWVPASWVVPGKSVSILVDPKESCNVNGQGFSFSGSKNTPSLNSCENRVSLTSSKSGSCVTPKTNKKFYSFTCKDYMEVEFTPSKSKYYRGDKFEIDVKVTTYAKCTGTFNVSTFNNADSRKYLKDTIKSNFLNFSLKSYSTNPTGYMNVYGKNVNLKITNTSTVSSASRSVSYSGSVPSSMTYTTNKRVMTMKLSSNVIVDKSRDNVPYKIYINNLGYSGKSQAVFDCEIEKILEFYRSVDPNNPFISASREVGENWKNSKYNFVDIIKSETWDEEPAYVFDLTEENIKKIKKNNNDSGANIYVGSGCKILNNRKYCSFIRDNTYFSKIKIYGVYQ